MATDTKKRSEEETSSAPEAKTDVAVVVEGEIKQKGLTPKTQGPQDPLFSPLSLADQQFIHANDLEGWNTLKENFRKVKDDAVDKATEMDLEKRQEELKQLEVKTYEEVKAKPEFLCVVDGCGEAKAPGQQYHCAVHSKGK